MSDKYLRMTLRRLHLQAKSSIIPQFAVKIGFASPILPNWNTVCIKRVNDQWLQILVLFQWQMKDVWGGKKMTSTVRGLNVGWRFIVPVLGIIAMLSQSTFANPWSRALGDARSVQSRTKDIAERLNREFPYSQATTVALHMDNAACQLVEDVKCGASWGQVQASLSRTCALASQVNALANADCSVRNDRRVRDYINDLSKRVERLRCNLDKAYAATQPKFCPPSVIVNRPSWSGSYQPDPFTLSPNIGRHNHLQFPRYEGSPIEDPRFNAAPGYPRDTYEFDAPQFEQQSIPFGTVPEALPLGRPAGPIEYQVERNVPSPSPRAAAFVQLGLQAIKLLSEDRYR